MERRGNIHTTAVRRARGGVERRQRRISPVSPQMTGQGSESRSPPAVRPSAREALQLQQRLSVMNHLAVTHMHCPMRCVENRHITPPPVLLESTPVTGLSRQGKDVGSRCLYNGIQLSGHGWLTALFTLDSCVIFAPLGSSSETSHSWKEMISRAEEYCNFSQRLHHWSI